jgi:hypothetical protein
MTARLPSLTPAPASRGLMALFLARHTFPLLLAAPPFACAALWADTATRLVLKSVRYAPLASTQTSKAPGGARRAWPAHTQAARRPPASGASPDTTLPLAAAHARPGEQGWPSLPCRRSSWCWCWCQCSCSCWCWSAVAVTLPPVSCWSHCTHTLCLPLFLHITVAAQHLPIASPARLLMCPCLQQAGDVL